MWQRFHIIDELAEYGITVEQINPLEFETAIEANNYLLSKVEIEDYKLFITPHNEEKLFLSTLNSIKSKSIPTLLICFDNLLVPFFHKCIAPTFDLVWLTSKETKYLFDSWGANSIFLPYAANPYMFEPSGDEDNGRICFIGSPYGSRVNTINKLAENDIEVDLFSGVRSSDKITKFAENKTRYFRPLLDLIKFKYGWMVIKAGIKQALLKPVLSDNGNIKFNPHVPQDDICRMYSEYGLSISSTTARNTGVLKEPLPVVNLRSFEIPMSGGLQICRYSKEIAGYFEEGKEIVLYKTDEEFVEKVKFYLADEQKSLRLEMKRNARARAIRDHSWKCRFEKIFSELEIQHTWTI